jgi:glycosyltransferase involved in cell wall biosynthesis
MRIALITPWANAWVPYFKQEIESRGHEFVLLKKPEQGNYDVALYGWANEGRPMIGHRNIVFMRRYELFDGGLYKVDWLNVSDLICVNAWIKDIAEEHLAKQGFDTKVHLIYNGTDLNRWTFKDRKPNRHIGMACHVHPKKNLPLAVQILAMLPKEYELHIAGEIQDGCTAEYLNHLSRAVDRKVHFYGHINMLNPWWEKMGYCLSTSLSEGNPNNVIEAMAKGIKPLVHRWPGSEDQFDDYLFSTVREAAGEILYGDYNSEEYRAHVQRHFSLDNIKKVVDLCVS